ncbi:phosphotransferase enzyme family protein [Shimia sp. W99]
MERDVHQLASDALLAWGVTAPPRLIKNRENVVFEACGPNGERAALRLHRPGYQSDDAIRSELWWAEALGAAGMDVPLPIRAMDGDVLAAVPGRVASLVTWMDGAPLGEGGVPLAMPEAEQVALHRALGAELARLHTESDNATLPDGFTRGVLDVEALVGETPAWGRFWENASLSTEESALLLQARARLRTVLLEHAAAAGDFGLIHADALRENVLVSRGRVRLIDFDDGVFGFRMYELGVAMSQNWDQPNRDALGVALLDGYGQVRALPGDAETLLQSFTVMRGLASCGWVIGRYPDDHPAVRDYAQRALEMVRAWL